MGVPLSAQLATREPVEQFSQGSSLERELSGYGLILQAHSISDPVLDYRPQRPQKIKAQPVYIV